MTTILPPLTGTELETYIEQVARLARTNAEIAVYTYTSYGQRPSIDVLRDIWVQKQTFAEVASVFFDEVEARASSFVYYELLANFAHLFQLNVVFNPGLPPEDLRFFGIADLVVVSENTRNVANEVALVSTAGISGRQIAGLQFAATQTQLSENFNAILAAGAKYAYVTELGNDSNNPWADISTGYSNYVSIAAAKDARILLPLYAFVSLWEPLFDINGSFTTAIVNPNDGKITGGEIFSSPQGGGLSIAGDGHDLMITTEGESEFYGESGNDFLLGGTGNDLLSGGGGDDLLLGGSGIDHALYNGSISQFAWSKTGNEINLIDITDLEGKDRLIDVERVHFSGMSLAFDSSGAPRTAMRLFQTITGNAQSDNPHLLGQAIARVDWGFTDLDLANTALEALRTL